MTTSFQSSSVTQHCLPRIIQFLMGSSHTVHQSCSLWAVYCLVLVILVIGVSRTLGWPLSLQYGQSTWIISYLRGFSSARVSGSSSGRLFSAGLPLLYHFDLMEGWDFSSCASFGKPFSTWTRELVTGNLMATSPLYVVDSIKLRIFRSRKSVSQLVTRRSIVKL